MGALDQLLAERAKPTVQPVSALDLLLASKAKPAPTSPVAPVIDQAPGPVSPGPRMSLLPKDGTIAAPAPGYMDKPGFVQSAVKSLENTYNDTVQRGSDLLAASGSQTPAPERVKTMVRAGLGAVNALFAIHSAVIEGAKNIQTTPPDQAPSMFDIPKRAIKAGATAIDAGMHKIVEGTNYGNEALFNALPQTPEVQQYKDVGGEVFGLLGMLAVGKGLHETIKVPGEIKKFRDQTITTNDIVKSAADVLGIQTEKNAIGQVKPVDAETLKTKYRQAAHETHPDRGGTPEEFQVVTKAKDILQDHADLSAKAFREKYAKPLEGVKAVIKQIPETAGQPAATPSAIDQVLAEKAKPQVYVEEAGKMVPIEQAKVQPQAVETAPGPTETPAVPSVPAEAAPAAPTAPTSEAQKTLFELVKERQKIAAERHYGPHNMEQAQKRAYGDAMQMAAIERKMSGKPTDKEYQNAKDYLQSNHAGKIVEVDGRPATLTGKSAFGRAQVVFEDGSKVHVEPDKIRAPKATHEDVMAHLKSEGQRALEGEAAIFGVKEPVQPEPRPSHQAVEQAKQEAADAVKVERANAKEAPPGKIEALYSDIISGKAKDAVPLEGMAADGQARKPVEGGKESKVGLSVKAKALEKGLTDIFDGTAQYTGMTIKDQAEKAAALIANEPNRARRIVMGQEPLPDGILGGTMIMAMADHAMNTGDAQLALDISKSPLTSETSVHAQELRILAERNPDSAVANIQRLQKMKEENAAVRGLKKERVVKEIREEIKKQRAKAQTKQTWHDFITSIEC